MGQCAELLDPLYERAKKLVLASKVVQTDDTPVKVLDPTLPKTRTGRIWPYLGDAQHPVVVYDYTATRERAGPEQFLKLITNVVERQQERQRTRTARRHP